jgi:hypothetical protein
MPRNGTDALIGEFVLAAYRVRSTSPLDLFCTNNFLQSTGKMLFAYHYQMSAT